LAGGWFVTAGWKPSYRFGIWHEPVSPLLSIFRTPTNTVSISWPSSSTDWNLEESTDLDATIWVTPLEGIADDGTNRFIVVNPPAGIRFYRLHKP
jgi:hypothetical protein